MYYQEPDEFETHNPQLMYAILEHPDYSSIFPVEMIAIISSSFSREVNDDEGLQQTFANLVLDSLWCIYDYQSKNLSWDNTKIVTEYTREVPKKGKLIGWAIDQDMWQQVYVYITDQNEFYIHFHPVTIVIPSLETTEYSEN